MAKYKCKTCGRQFVTNPQWRPVSEATKVQIQQLLWERSLLAGIVRVTGVSARWLQSYVNELYAQQPQQTMVCSKKTAFDAAMRRDVELRGPTAQQALALARHGGREP
jgi:hypothetical protein